MDTAHQGQSTGPVRAACRGRESAPAQIRPAPASGSWVLGSADHRRFVGSLIAVATPGSVVTLEPPRRSGLQNRYLHALLSDIAEQLPWPKDTGEFHDAMWWKRRCTLQWLIDIKSQALRLREKNPVGLESDGIWVAATELLQQAFRAPYWRHQSERPFRPHTLTLPGGFADLARRRPVPSLTGRFHC